MIDALPQPHAQPSSRTCSGIHRAANSAASGQVAAWTPARGRGDGRGGNKGGVWCHLCHFRTSFSALIAAVLKPRLAHLRRWIASLLALLALFTIASPAAAWWEYGHETVAKIAMSQVQPRSRAEILALLKKQAVLETPTCPARTIEQASIWPDCIKTLGDRFSYVFSWHFQDVEPCKPFDVKSVCANGNCVSVQIARAQRMLADRKLPPRDRLMALAFLVHFVGDIHQPLHAVEHDGDQGGNKVKAIYGAGVKTNLHSIWDGYLAERGITSPPPDAAGILSEISPDQRKALAAGTIDDWGRESWEIAKESVYGSVEKDICAPTPKEPVTMDEATIEKLIPVVRLQVAKGGLRLARLLDEALDGDHPEVAHPPKPPKPAPVDPKPVMDTPAKVEATTPAA